MTDTAIFTNEAKRMLKDKPTQLRKEAISEALLNRGSPIEVTESDVKRAHIRQASDRKVKHIASFVDIFLYLNMVLGACVFIGSTLTFTSMFRGKIEFFLLALGGTIFLISLFIKSGRNAEVRDRK